MNEKEHLIYLLEDDLDIMEMVQFLLESEGYKVSTSKSVAEFQSQIQTRIPDLALLDIRLPDGDGRQVCSQLRKKKETRELPIILMSANTIPEEMTGANDFIPKPFDIDDLVQRIGSQLPITNYQLINYQLTN